MTSLQPPIEYLIFDLDGVLIDSSPCHRVAYQKLWNKLGIHGPEYSSIAGKRTVEVVSTITHSLAPTETKINEWVIFKQKIARREMERDLKVCSGAVEIINRLHADGWRMSVATGASRTSALLALGSLGLTACFDFIVTADEVIQGKPDPMVFNEVLRRSRVPAEKALVLEDSQSGVDAAIAAGIRVCTVHTGVRSDADLFMGAYANLNEGLIELGVFQ